MHIYVDDNPYAVSGLADKTLRQIAMEIRQDLAVKKRMLVAVYTDGLLVPSDELEQVLAREVLRQSRELAAEAAPLCQQAGELLSGGQTARAMELLGNCIGVWNQVQESLIKSAGLVGLDLANLQVEGKRVNDLMDEFAGQLRQVKDALENRDYVQLSDILQYELPDVAPRWQALLDQLIEQIDKA
jgi:hypothetical protein